MALQNIVIDFKTCPHKVTEVKLHYGNWDASEKDTIFKMSFGFNLPNVEKTFQVQIPFASCLDILKNNNNGPMASYIEKVLDSIDEDVQMREFELMKVLNAEEFNFDDLVEGVLFNINIEMENIPVEDTVVHPECFEKPVGGSLPK